MHINLAQNYSHNMYLLVTKFILLCINVILYKKCIKDNLKLFLGYFLTNDIEMRFPISLDFNASSPTIYYSDRQSNQYNKDDFLFKLKYQQACFHAFLYPCFLKAGYKSTFQLRIVFIIFI